MLPLFSQASPDLANSPLAAFLTGLIVGFILGTAFGLWLGKSFGYQPSLFKFVLAIGLVALGATIGFLGWHYWEAGDLPSASRLLSAPLGAEYAGTLRNSLGTGGALAAGILVCLVAAYPAGRRQKSLEKEAEAAEERAREARQRAEEARRREEEATEARRRAEEAQRVAEEEAAAARRRDDEAQRRALVSARQTAEAEIVLLGIWCAEPAKAASGKVYSQLRFLSGGRYEREVRISPTDLMGAVAVFAWWIAKGSLKLSTERGNWRVVDGALLLQPDAGSDVPGDRVDNSFVFQVDGRALIIRDRVGKVHFEGSKSG